MTTSIDIKTNNYKNITLFDTHDITLHRDGANNAELVIHPCHVGRISVRFSKDPYACLLYLEDGRTIDADLSASEDWGEIDTTNPNCPQYGNDNDGYVKIDRVETLLGVRIPLGEFSRDVADFIIYHEG